MSGEKILIVEDSPTVAFMILDELEEAGYEPMVALNGFEALREVELFGPDLILADIELPKVDGLELCEAIQNRIETRDIPFILMSSHTDPETVARGKKLGAKYFIAKPFEIEVVVEHVRKVLGE